MTIHARFPQVPAWQAALSSARDVTDRYGVRHTSAAGYLSGLV